MYSKDIEVSLNLEKEQVNTSISIEKLQDVNADVSLSTGGTLDHNKLKNRDIEDQHPISAITDLSEILDTKQPIGDYALKSEIPIIPSNISDFVNDVGYVTDSYHDSTKQDIITDLETIREGASKGETALQSVPDEYVTEKELNAKGYLTEHQDISNLATKDEVSLKQDELTSENAGNNLTIIKGTGVGKNLCSGVFNVTTKFLNPIPAGTVLSFSANGTKYTASTRLRVRFFAEDATMITNFYPALNTTTNRVEMKNLKYTKDIYSYWLSNTDLGEYQLELGPECTAYEPYQEGIGGGKLKISAVVPTKTSQLTNDSGFIVPRNIQGYDVTKTQTLKHVNGVLQWVSE